MIRTFRTNPNYLRNYHLKSAALFLALNAALITWKQPDLKEALWFIPALFILASPRIWLISLGFCYTVAIACFMPDFHLFNLSGIALGVVLTFPLTAFLHGTSHDSMRPRWLNRPVGEIAGLMQLYGYPDWKILHVVHHTYSDDVDFDPHPPTNKSYLSLALNMRTYAMAAFVKYYFRYFERNERSMKALQQFGRASKTDTFLRGCFWFLALGPQAFTFVFMGSVVFKMFHYSWFNYATHRPEGNSVDIKNLNHGLYKVVNSISFNLYYHRNHHLQPSLFNPKNMKTTPKQQSLVTEEKAA